MMRPIICFIDDSPFEHDLVRTEVAPAASHFSFVQAYTFEEARGLLDDKPPCLFLLDLWGQDEDVDEPRMTSQRELEEKISLFPTLEGVYEGLGSFEGDVINEYLKRLFRIVDSWRGLFEAVCNRVGQNRKYGLSNLKKAREHYPGCPAVFYTRKSLIGDAVALFRDRADGLYIKPTGRDDEETRRLTREYAPELLSELSRIIDSKEGMNVPS
jgi:hypothetical protein